MTTTAPDDLTPAQIVVSRSAVVPNDESERWLPPTWRLVGASNQSENTNLTNTGTLLTLQGPRRKRLLVGGDTIGLSSGTLYIGVLTTCLISRPFFVGNPNPWPGYSSNSRCDPGTHFNLQGWALPSGRVMRLTQNYAVTGMVQYNQVVQYEFVLSGLCTTLEIFLTSVHGDADVYASNVDHLASWLSNTWNSRKPGNDYIMVSRMGNDFDGDTIRIVVSCESEKVCPSTYVLRVVESPVLTQLDFESYLSARPCVDSCTNPVGVGGTCCGPADMFWFPICFERNSSSQLVISQPANAHDPCHFPTATLRHRGSHTAHRPASARFGSEGCSSVYSFDSQKQVAGYYQVGLHFECQEAPCTERVNSSRFLIRTRTPRGMPTQSSSPAGIHRLENSTLSAGHAIGDVLSFNLTDICTNTIINSSCDHAGYTLRAGIGAIPAPGSNQFEWTDSSLGTNKSLSLQSLDPMYKKGQLYIWLQPRGSSQEGTCRVTAVGVRIPSQLLILDSPLGQNETAWPENTTWPAIAWHQVCIPEGGGSQGLNVTAVGVGAVQPHFVVTRDLRVLDAQINQLNAPAWMSYHFWYPVLRNYCVSYDIFDECIQGGRNADNLVLCEFMPGVSVGSYLIGVFVYCMPPTPFFPPVPQPASFTYNGLPKLRCDQNSRYNLYVSPTRENCSAPLMSHAPRSARATGSRPARFHLDLDTVCDGFEATLVKYHGNPDAFISSVDGAPGLVGFSQQLRSYRNGILSTTAQMAEHRAGRQYLSVFCALGSECPANFVVEAIRTRWDSSTQENSYSSRPAQIRQFQAVCIGGDDDGLFMSAKNLVPAPTNLAMAHFRLPLSNHDRYAGPTVRSGALGLSHIPASVHGVPTNGLEITLTDSLDPGLYYLGIFYQASTHHTGLAYPEPLTIAASFNTTWKSTQHPTQTQQSQAPFRVWNVLIQVPRQMPCPSHSAPDVYDNLEGPTKRCRCSSAKFRWEVSYRAMEPSDPGYDPDYPQCQSVDGEIERDNLCQRGVHCGGRYECGPEPSGMCQELPQIEVGTDLSFNGSKPAVLTADDGWFYFQHLNQDPCVDITFQANVTTGRVEILVSNLPDTLPTESTFTWTSNSAGGLFDTQPQVAQVTVSHTDEHYTTGLWLSLIHISEPTRLLSISYAVFCLKKKKKKKQKQTYPGNEKEMTT
eukprot:TRINITY_DN5310_c0_g1_i1.p1 TRINITY_DN5310_c0_g1~~TRINITY_DN5310_c0_g1_i1.p1  ORF type:complete len:1174 (-),score=127.03 TRINITY_DN5310_c0_g1_i1:88-3609(-)